MSREPIGEIDCPWCGREAELHAYADRRKVSPEGDRPSYPRKCFVICPPIQGYRGCGTTIANGPLAQERMMENGHVFGPDGKPPAAAAKPKPAKPAEPLPPAEPAPAKPTKPAEPAGLFRPFRW